MSKLTKRQLKEEFNKFLRENGCASKFYANLYHPKAKRWRERHKLLHDFEYEAINYAFEWSESKTSGYYWNCLSFAWARKYKELTA